MSRAALLDWYDKEKRELPWRRAGTDAYAIWVSEVMLQQTRVETVVPYYERFMAAFPDAATLAAASLDDVLARWSGLGYYRRARLLHRGVREVVAKYGGRVPEDPGARRALPGVGRYTAGAIGSIAFGRAEPIVDGNVARVLSRVHGITTPLGRADTMRELWARATELVEGPRPGDLNQALMELGARRCTKSSPRCEGCAFSSSCVALAEGRTEELPVPKRKAKPKLKCLSAVLATSKSGEMLFARYEGALFSGLFGPPMGEGQTRDAARSALRKMRITARLASEPHAHVEHVLTHRRLNVQIWRANSVRVEASDSLRWVRPDALFLSSSSEIGTSSLTRKIVQARPR